MRFAIISDSHDNQPNILKALDYLNKQNITILIHCGDVTSPDSLELFCKNFAGEIHLVLGNGDFEREELKSLEHAYKNLHVAGEVDNISLNSKKIVWSHYPARALELAETGKYDVVFYGHDHTPFERVVNQTKVINPGNLDGSRHKATFAIYDTTTNKAELILLEKI